MKDNTYRTALTNSVCYTHFIYLLFGKSIHQVQQTTIIKSLLPDVRLYWHLNNSKSLINR